MGGRGGETCSLLVSYQDVAVFRDDGASEAALDEKGHLGVGLCKEIGHTPLRERSEGARVNQQRMANNPSKDNQLRAD